MGCLKVHERNFVNDVTKYNMALQNIIVVLKDKDPENLTSVTQVYKARATHNASNRGPLMEMKMLMTLIHRENTRVGLKIGKIQILLLIYSGHILVK